MTKIAGRKIRSQSITTTIASLRAARAAGLRVVFTSDNFNKYPEAEELLAAMIDERFGPKFFVVQCDTQIARQERLVELLARAGCFQMFVGVESFNRHTLLAARKGQNRPDTYRDIVRLCREHGIASHFSIIIGFPDDTAKAIRGHVELLGEMSPTFASFYVLCPIPGTEQYDDFLEGGLIVEKNLDRFDTTCLTWRHPTLGREQLTHLLFESYRKFYSPRHSLNNFRYLWFREEEPTMAVADTAMALFNRYCAWRQTHPMSGGIKRVRRDRVDDFLAQRRRTFGFELAPLPQSLQLPTAESAPSRPMARSGSAAGTVDSHASIGDPVRARNEADGSITAH